MSSFPRKQMPRLIAYKEMPLPIIDAEFSRHFPGRRRALLAEILLVDAQAARRRDHLLTAAATQRG